MSCLLYTPLLESGHSLPGILSAIQSRLADYELPSTINRQINTVHTYILDDIFDSRSHLVDGKRYSGEGGMFQEIIGEEG